jgi:hypothetical protein
MGSKYFAPLQNIDPVSQDSASYYSADTGVLYPGIKLMRHEGKHPTLPSAEIKKEWICTFAPP